MLANFGFSKIYFSDSAQWSPISDFHLKFEYLQENEFLRENILTCLLGAKMGLNHEIKNAKKSRDTATFKVTLSDTSKHFWPQILMLQGLEYTCKAELHL